MKVLIIGGDRRMLSARRELEKNGFYVDTLGLIEGDRGNISDADTVLLPAPATRDGININCPITKARIPLETLKKANPNTKIFGGGKHEISNYTNYLALDEYALQNAVLTAEGALSYAIEHTDFSLWKSNVLVIGYGRVGKIITDRLNGFKPKLTVSARNPRDFAMLDALGFSHINTEAIESVSQRFDIVFNTVDIKFSERTAESLSGALFIDLSSYGGLPENAGERHNITYVKLPGIPGKTAPDTAGKIIAETVIKSLNIKGEKYA